MALQLLQQNCNLRSYSFSPFLWLCHKSLDPEELNPQLTEWLVEYNFNRPHQSLGYLAPVEYIERELYQREIAKLAGISIGATSQRLRQLSEYGMVTFRKSGKMLFYRYNLQDPVAKQFKILVNVNAVHGMVGQLRSQAKRVVLFGSCAEGTNVKGSDIDLLILSEEAMKVGEIASKYSEKLSR